MTGQFDRRDQQRQVRAELAERRAHGIRCRHIAKAEHWRREGLPAHLAELQQRLDARTARPIEHEDEHMIDTQRPSAPTGRLADLITRAVDGLSLSATAVEAEEPCTQDAATSHAVGAVWDEVCDSLKDFAGDAETFPLPLTADYLDGDGNERAAYWDVVTDDELLPIAAHAIASAALLRQEASWRVMAAITALALSPTGIPPAE